jgi:hypothetical protein
LFQIVTNWNRKIVTRAGTIIRVAIEPKMRRSPAPSIRAASRTSSGTAAFAWIRARYTPKGLTMLGSSTAQYVPVSPIALRRKYSGKAMIVAGTSTPPRMIENSVSLPRNANFAMA